MKVGMKNGRKNVRNMRSKPSHNSYFFRRMKSEGDVLQSPRKIVLVAHPHILKFNNSFRGRPIIMRNSYHQSTCDFITSFQQTALKITNRDKVRTNRSNGWMKTVNHANLSHPVILQKIFPLPVVWWSPSQQFSLQNSSRRWCLQ
jgi:hypothetical protein